MLKLCHRVIPKKTVRDNEKTTSYSHIVRTLSNQVFRYLRVGTYILIVPKY